MNNLGETFTNLLNTSFSEAPLPPKLFELSVINNNEGVCTVEIIPSIPEGQQYEEGTEIETIVTNKDSGIYSVIKFLGVYDDEDPSKANCILDLSEVYKDTKASGSFRIDRNSYLII